MVVEFLRDFRGRPTGEKFFSAGQQVDTDQLTYLDVSGLLVEGAIKILGPAHDPEPDPEPAPVQLSDLTVAELQAMARRLGIPYSGKRKAELVEALS